MAKRKVLSIPIKSIKELIESRFQDFVLSICFVQFCTIFSKVTVTNETTVVRMCTMTTTKTVTKTSFPVETKS